MAAAHTPRRVLVVEDDDNIATALEFVVARAGLIYHRLALGQGAVDAIRHQKPDLVLLDIMLPDASGYDICRAIRADAGLGEVRVLIMTARGSVAERQRAEEVGADGFLAKPFDLNGLRQELARVLT
ncbi:MAG: response regulator [Rhodobacteraceae bacterium]|nr:response regulator [Paracoccaceae bacterium]